MKDFGEVMMKKLAVVINGSGGAGKDTLCEFASKRFKTVNVSSIDPIKRIASENGWKGEKTPSARRFLAELKRVFSEYNDLPTVYTVEKYREFLDGDDEIFFVHIRESEQIEHFIECASQYGGRIVTLLVRSSRCAESYGNVSDDDVENYNYDYYFTNDLPLDETEKAFTEFLLKII